MAKRMREGAGGAVLALVLAVSARPAAALKLPELGSLPTSFENAGAPAAAPAPAADVASGDEAVILTLYVKAGGADLFSKKPEQGEKTDPLRLTQLFENEPVRQLGVTKDGWSLVEVDRLTEYNEKAAKWENSKGWVRSDSLGGDAAAGAQWQISRLWYGPGPGGAPAPAFNPALIGAPAPTVASASAGAPAPAVTRDPSRGLLDAFIQSLLSFQGTPYKWGGTSPGRDGGVDCSGLIVASLTKIGFGRIPRTAADQQRATGAQSLTDAGALKPGDLLFEGHPAHHVLVYIGQGQVIESPHTGAVVRITPLAARLESLKQVSYGTILP